MSAPLRRPTAAARRGLTLIELVLATALMAILMVAVFALLDGSLSLWRRAETRRNLSEQAIGVVELLARDLTALEPGQRGDLLVDWYRFDLDGDGVGDEAWPRLRLVRQASAAEIARMLAGEDRQALKARGVRLPDGAALIEVCWLVTPAVGEREARAEGNVWRGAQLLSERGGEYFERGFLGRDGKPPGGALDEVTGGVLWLCPLLATQTSIVHDRWTLGHELEDAATSWDAWNRGRPDATSHPWNEPGVGMPAVGDLPLLPRRVRIEIELERPVDRLRRTRLTSFVEPTDVRLTVDDTTRLPREEDAYVRVDGEWMRVRDIGRGAVTVERGQRGTDATTHAPGAMVHWGLRMVREVPVRLYREDWEL